MGRLRGEVNAAGVRFANDCVIVGEEIVPFGTLVTQAYLARVQLWSDGFYATPKLYWDQATLRGRPFYYYSYGAAVSEVVIDTLTGEMRVLRADALHDVGASLNPALDVGQVEGGFIQGMGWLTTEELWEKFQECTLKTHSLSAARLLFNRTQELPSLTSAAELPTAEGIFSDELAVASAS